MSMSKEELLRQLADLVGGDPEIDHIKADGLLLEFIGDADIEAAYDAVSKWYA